VESTVGAKKKEGREEKKKKDKKTKLSAGTSILRSMPGDPLKRE